MQDGKEHLEKFDSKSNEGIFLRYDSNSSSYRIFNKRTLTIESSVHITFDETNLPKVEKGDSSNVDRLIEGFEDLDLIKDDEAIAPINQLQKKMFLLKLKIYPKKEDGQSIIQHPTSSEI